MALEAGVDLHVLQRTVAGLNKSFTALNTAPIVQPQNPKEQLKRAFDAWSPRQHPAAAEDEAQEVASDSSVRFGAGSGADQADWSGEEEADSKSDAVGKDPETSREGWFQGQPVQEDATRIEIELDTGKQEPTLDASKEEEEEEEPQSTELFKR